MKYITSQLPLTHTLSNILKSYLPQGRLGVFDIETTGLSPKYNQVILIGLIIIEGDILVAKQWLAESTDEEALLLLAFHKDCKDLSLLFNYNGSSFDIPFVNKRCQSLCLEGLQINPLKSMDLYRIIRQSYFKDLLPDLKQKTVERLFSQARTDTISGGDSVILYEKYVQTKDSSMEAKILLHNFDDIRILYEILSVFNKLDIHAVMMKNGFWIKSGFVERIKLERHTLKIRVLIPKLGVHMDEFIGECRFKSNPDEGHLVIHMPLAFDNTISYVDLVPFDLSHALSHLPTYHSGYLILSEDGHSNSLAINNFVRELVEKILHTYDILL